MTPAELTAARQVMERAYRVAFDSDPFDNHLKQIELSAERVCNGDVFEWREIDGERLLIFAKDNEAGELQEAVVDPGLSDEAEEEQQALEAIKHDPEKSPRRLSQRQQNFCRLVAQGIAQGRAYQMAGYTCANNNVADANAGRLVKSPWVKRYLREVRTALHKMDVLSLAEKRIGLAEVWRTPVGEIDENHPLAQEVRRKIVTSKDGTTTEEVTVKMPGKLEALKLDAQIAGELNEQQQVNVGFNFGMLNMEPEEAQVIDVETQKTLS